MTNSQRLKAAGQRRTERTGERPLLLKVHHCPPGRLTTELSPLALTGGNVVNEHYCVRRCASNGTMTVLGSPPPHQGAAATPWTPVQSVQTVPGSSWDQPTSVCVKSLLLQFYQQYTFVVKFIKLHEQKEVKNITLLALRLTTNSWHTFFWSLVFLLKVVFFLSFYYNIL